MMLQKLNDINPVTLDPKLDAERLGKQIDRVRDYMLDGRWHTLEEISLHTGAPPASASARLRDLRKPKFGCYFVERRRAGHPKAGIWEYRIGNRGEQLVFLS